MVSEEVSNRYPCQLVDHVSSASIFFFCLFVQLDFFFCLIIFFLHTNVPLYIHVYVFIAGASSAGTWSWPLPVSVGAGRADSSFRVPFRRIAEASTGTEGNVARILARRVSTILRSCSTCLLVPSMIAALVDSRADERDYRDARTSCTPAGRVPPPCNNSGARGSVIASSSVQSCAFCATVFVTTEMSFPFSSGAGR